MREGNRPTGRSPTARQQLAAARREQILETVLGLFAERGFDGTSTRQIAKVAGIAEGLIFHYFPTKASLLTAILEDRLEGQRAFRTRLRPLLDDAGGKPAPEVLRAVASGWLATLRRDEEIVVVLFTAAQTNSEVRQAWQGLIREGTELLTAYLASRVDAGELRKDVAHDLLPNPPSPAGARVERTKRGLRAGADLRVARRVEGMNTHPPPHNPLRKPLSSAPTLSWPCC
jgi:AcrR family transcriptional regulator